MQHIYASHMADLHAYIIIYIIHGWGEVKKAVTNGTLSYISMVLILGVYGGTLNHYEHLLYIYIAIMFKLL